MVNPGGATEITPPPFTGTDSGETTTSVVLSFDQQEPALAWEAFIDAYVGMLTDPASGDAFSLVADLATDSVVGTLISQRQSLVAQGRRALVDSAALRTRTAGPIVSVDGERTFLLDCLVLPFDIIDASGSKVFPDAPRDAYFDVQLVLVDGAWLVDAFMPLEECPI